jgi:hypothetical protein
MKPAAPRALSERQALACETATDPRCACRCGGKYHGANRVKDLGELPTNDPHAPDPQRELPMGGAS